MKNEQETAPRTDDMKRALVAIRDLRKRVEELESGGREPVAVIGMACRLPGGATTPAKLWELLRNGVDATDEVPRERWDVDAFYDVDPETPGMSYVRRAGFLRDPVNVFDPGFFGISPKEADALDPMHRMLLEMAWETIEDAAMPAGRFEGSDTGVFIGMSGSDYDVLQRENLLDINSYRGTGAISSVAAGRISHFLSLHGPNVAMDTACSSALVAISLAVDAVRTGRCGMAFAGTAHLILSPEGTIMLSKLRALSPEGRCRTFDAGANGYARAEGGGMFLLKKLSAAIADGDPILAVVRGAAINHDGRSSGLTVPNPVAQRAVIEAALRNGGLAPSSVSYVEAHGTGTPLGDPIELRALAAALRPDPASAPLMVGSVKTNLGHLEPAAGAAGLAKVILSLRHRQLPPHLHLTEPTPHVDWNQLNLQVPTTLTEWEAEPRVAGISGFGFSGTNAHIIVEQAPARPDDERPRRPAELILLSGRSRQAVSDLAGRYSELLAEAGDDVVADLAATSALGRTALPFRAAVVGASAEELRAALDEIAAEPNQKVAHWKAASAGPVAMMFTGQGAQYPGMARELYETSSVFRAEIDRCAAILEAHMDRPLLPLILDADQGDALRQTAYTQPSLFAVEYALASLWRSWGIEPAYVLGHSLGEYVAATVAGVMDLEHALPLIALRGRLMQALPQGGRMAAVFAGEAQVARAIDGLPDIAMAAVNAANSIVISGSGESVAEALARLATDGVQSKELEVSHAFHSPLMDPMLAEFEKAIAAIPLRAPSIPLISNLTGDVLTAADAVDPARWRRHIREPVRFGASMAKLEAAGVRTFLEVGPHPVLCGLGAQTITSPVAWLPSTRRNVSAWKQIGQTAGELFKSGQPVDWEEWSREFAGRRANGMPSYAFQREYHWFTDPAAAAGSSKHASKSRRNVHASGGPQPHPLLHEVLQSPAIDGWVFQSALQFDDPAYLEDHQVQNKVIVPGAAFIEMMLGALAAGPSWAGAVLSDVAFEAPLVLHESADVLCQVIVSAPVEGRVRIRVMSSSGLDRGSHWTMHAAANALHAAAVQPMRDTELDQLRARLVTPRPPEELYERLRAHGIEYGPAFRGLHAVWTDENDVLAHARLPEGADIDTSGYTAHPCLLDLGFQMLESLAPDDEDTSVVYLPAGVDEVVLFRPLGTSCWIHAVLRPQGADTNELVADLTLYADSGECIAELRGFRARRLRGALKSTAASNLLYSIRWETVATPAAPPRLDGTWLLLEDAAGTGALLAGELERAGGQCIRVQRAGAGTTDDAIVIDPASPADWHVVVDAVRVSGTLRGVVHLWSLDDGPGESGTADEWLEHVVGNTDAIRELLHIDGVARATHGLRVITRGAVPAGYETASGSEAGAAVWGMLRVVQAEYPELSCRAIDLEPRTRAGETDALLALLYGATSEDRIAVRDGVCLAPRLARGVDEVGERLALPAGAPYSIEITQRGTLDALRYVPAERRAPEADEVEVRVRATGLNFRDVLNVLGMYPGNPGNPGVEFAGLVTRTGENVRHVAPGDEVIGIGGGAFASYNTGPAAAVSLKPRSLSAVEAATIPLAFLTAEWGLHDLARLQPGERVLIHAAAGGVGQAAVLIAQAMGAEVFATAGSEEKREHLRSQGVRHVFDSRSVSFAEGVRQATSGEGVDVVLNSLTGELLQQSLELLRPGGRFLEIGKAEMLDPATAAARYPHIQYFAYDLGTVLIEQPAVFQALFTRVTAQFEDGTLAPLATRVYPAEEVVDAFRFMAQARHIGKVVVTAGRIATQERPAIQSDGAYLVTGAAGGVGRAVAAWLVKRGAGAIYLSGRHEPDSEMQSWITRLQSAGYTRVEWITGDVARAADAERMIREAVDGGTRLRGIFHAAGIVDDGLLNSQTRERFARVMAAKVAGTWNLHMATRGLDLDTFVMFSSIAAVIGGPGQASYAAANAFMDALAESRARQGLPGLSINWGAWADAGMASRMGERERKLLEERGMGFLRADQATPVMGSLLRIQKHRAIIAKLDWGRLAAGARHVPPIVKGVIADVTAPAKVEAPVITIRIDRSELAALTEDARRARLSEYTCHTLGGVLGVRGRTLDEDTEVGQLGFDSLMAMELRNRIESDVGIIVPVARLLQAHTAADLVVEVLAAFAGEAPELAAAGSAGQWTEGDI